MTQSTGTEALEAILTDLHGDVSDIVGSLIITRDGLTMAAQGLRFDVNNAGAVCTELHNQGSAFAAELHQGKLKEVLLTTEEGYVLVAPAGEYAFLALLTRTDPNLGLVFLESQRTAAAIASALQHTG